MDELHKLQYPIRENDIDQTKYVIVHIFIALFLSIFAQIGRSTKGGLRFDVLTFLFSRINQIRQCVFGSKIIYINIFLSLLPDIRFNDLNNHMIHIASTT